MYVLTVATVVLGALATVAGVLGMNFNAPFFETGVRGFIVAVGGMGLFGSIVIGLTIWRRRRSRAVSVPVRAAPRRLMARGDRHR
jgi:Mg2+ and Co2+ transporter CorA